MIVKPAQFLGAALAGVALFLSGCGSQEDPNKSPDPDKLKIEAKSLNEARQREWSGASK